MFPAKNRGSVEPHFRGLRGIIHRGEVESTHLTPYAALGKMTLVSGTSINTGSAIGAYTVRDFKGNHSS